MLSWWNPTPLLINSLAQLRTSFLRPPFEALWVSKPWTYPWRWYPPDRNEQIGLIGDQGEAMFFMQQRHTKTQYFLNKLLGTGSVLALAGRKSWGSMFSEKKGLCQMPNFNAQRLGVQNMSEQFQGSITFTSFTSKMSKLYWLEIFHIVTLSRKWFLQVLTGRDSMAQM